MTAPTQSSVDVAYREGRLIGAAAAVVDLASRVRSNGAEPNYASEKLGRALEELGEAFALIDLFRRERDRRDPTDVAAIVKRAYDREAERLAWITCPRCNGFRYTIDGGRHATGLEPEGAGDDCTACRGRGQVPREPRQAPQSDSGGGPC
jgi:hypothetical protein